MISLKEKGNFDTEIHREDGHVEKTEADTELRLPPTKECLGLPEAERAKEGSSSRGFRDCMSLSTTYGLYLEL